MIRKTILVAGVALLGGVLLFGRDAISYVSTSVGCLKDSVKNSVPVEFQIERARRMIDELAPEIRKNMGIIAKEEVEVQRLQERIAKAEAQLAKDKEQVVRLKGDLATAKESYTYAGRTYTADDVKTDLARRFERYKTAEATLASLGQLHAARTKSVDAARQKLEAMLAARRQLQVDVENLEAQRQMVAAAQTTSSYCFDDSKLGRVKELISDLRTRLDTDAKLVQAEQEFQDEIPLDKPTPANIVDQVSEYFQKDKPKAENVVVK
jgi:chromosome segregation ATPase